LGGLTLKIGVFTSSRADYGIYLPLLRALKSDEFFELHLLVFGTHLAEKYGYTAHQIVEDGFDISHRFITAPENDSPGHIVKSMSTTMVTFSSLWEKESFDMLLALGDRYEMFAAVASTVAFNYPVAHIHGGETTWGAIDNVFRHCITSMAKYHFTASEEYKKRVIEIKGNDQGVYNVGALSIDALSSIKFLTIREFYEKYKIDLNKPTILFTFHPETVSYQKNEEYIIKLIEVLKELREYQFVITMPNADTMGNTVRNNLKSFINTNKNAYGIESFGSVGYLSCMKYCLLILGNSSSGFVEASWFPKTVINVGERQKGRILTPNIITCAIDKEEILNAITNIDDKEMKSINKIYGKGDTARRIISLIKEFTRN
jgi:GDP/UDP-N,N'-diacetylbacillosamine 2-epimerase (hydrolysing)